MTQNGSAKWARWQWASGKGRWHRLFTDGDLTKTACQSPRKSTTHTAVETAGQPGSKVCAACQWIDGLHQKLVSVSDINISVTTQAPVSVPELVPVALDPKPVVPNGICICGCQQSDEARAYRRSVAEWEAREHDRKVAAFEAFLATKAMPDERRDRLTRIAAVYPDAAMEAAQS